jgi:hypothetical protein
MRRALLVSAGLLVGVAGEACSQSKFRAEARGSGDGGTVSGASGEVGAEAGAEQGGSESVGGTGGRSGAGGTGGRSGAGGTGGNGGRAGDGTAGSAGDEEGGGGSVVVPVCTPSERSCLGNLAELCNDEGTGFLAGTDCTAIGARCLNGRCESGLAAYWPFDDASGALVSDASGNGHDGVALATEWVAGRVRGAIQIGRSGSYVELGDRLNDLAVPFSISSWVWVDGPGGATSVLLASDASAVNWAGFWLSRAADGKLEVTYGDGNGAGPRTRRTLQTDASLPLQQWVHVAAVVTPELSLFVGGVKVPGTLSGTGGAMVHTPDPFYIGTRDRADTGWNGRLDELRLYQRALSAEEISALAEP